MKINQHSIVYRLYTLFFILFLLPSSLVFAQEKEGPLAFDAFSEEGMTKTEGVLPIYQKGENIYLEIPQKLIGREIEIRAQVNRRYDRPFRQQ